MQSGLVLASLTVCSTKAITGTYHTSQLLPLMWSNRVGVFNTFVERRKWDSDTFAGVKIYPFLINDTSHQNHALQFVLQIFTHFKPFPQKTICACCSSWSFLTLPSPFKKNSDDFSSSCHSYKHTKLYLSFLYIHYVMQNINTLQSFLFVLVLLNPPLS